MQKFLSIVGAALVGLLLIAIPIVLWGLVMMVVMTVLSWLVSFLYHAGPAVIFDWPDIEFWHMFFTLWILAIIGNLLFKRSS